MVKEKYNDHMAFSAILCRLVLCPLCIWQVMVARVISFRVPEGMPEILDALDCGTYKRYLKENTDNDVPVQVAEQPFAEGLLELWQHQ